MSGNADLNRLGEFNQMGFNGEQAIFEDQPHEGFPVEATRALPRPQGSFTRGGFARFGAQNNFNGENLATQGRFQNAQGGVQVPQGGFQPRPSLHSGFVRSYKH